MQFNDFSYDLDGNIVSWQWNFGDGSTSTLQNPMHQYSSPGNYNVTLTVMDNDRATDSITKCIMVVAGDTDPPITTCILSGNKGNHEWYISNVVVTLNATDDKTGVNATYYKVDNGGWQEYAGSFIISANGEYVLSFYSIDNYGNVEKVKTRRIKIDKTTPWTEIIVRGNKTNGWYVNHVIIAFIGHDSYSGIDKIMYKLDEGKWQRYDAAIDVWQEGKHMIEYYAIDKAGNEEAINSFNFKIDKGNPYVEVVYPNGGEIVNRGIDIKWIAEDISNLSISIYYSNDNGTTWHLIAANEENDGLYTWNTTSMEDGMNYKIKVVAEDEVGHIGYDTSDGSFTIYNHPITAILQKPKQGYLYLFDREIMPLPKITIIIGKITIIASVSSGLGVMKVEFYINEELKASDDSSPYEWLWDEKARGIYEIKVVAYDSIDTASDKIDAVVFMVGKDL